METRTPVFPSGRVGMPVADEDVCAASACDAVTAAADVPSNKSRREWFIWWPCPPTLYRTTAAAIPTGASSRDNGGTDGDTSLRYYNPPGIGNGRRSPGLLSHAAANGEASDDCGGRPRARTRGRYVPPLAGP